MSGKSISSGVLTNNGDKLLQIEKFLDLRIEDLSIQIIPLAFNTGITFLKHVGKVL